MNYLGEILPILIIVFVLIFGFINGLPIFSIFVKGAKKGIETTVSILPTLIGIVTGITMLSSSGALTCFVNLTKDFFQNLGFPSEILPLAILRPISGSGANSAVIEIFKSNHPDSFVGMIASVLSSSTETTFYAVSVYMGARAYRSLSYTIPVALFGDLFATVLSVLVINFLQLS